MRNLPGTLPVRATLVLASLLVASSCGLSSNARNPFDGSLQQQEEDRLRISVQNMNFNDITVYAISSGQRVRVGSVTGKTDGTFRLPWNYANPISFEINVIGGRGCDTPPISVDPGARIWVQVPNQVGMGQCRSGRA
ncbi:MAG: hypothetical protein WD995_05120 [Gemmatimonadota bacterium]